MRKFRCVISSFLGLLFVFVDFIKTNHIGFDKIFFGTILWYYETKNLEFAKVMIL